MTKLVGLSNPGVVQNQETTVMSATGVQRPPSALRRRSSLGTSEGSRIAELRQSNEQGQDPVSRLKLLVVSYRPFFLDTTHDIRSLRLSPL